MRAIFAFAALFSLFTIFEPLSALPAEASENPYAELNDSWDRFGAVFGRIISDYYSYVPPDSLMQAAIQGMLESLDDYSQFYDSRALRQLRQDTSGRFAGLGITVSVLDGYPVVVFPMENTPAYKAGLMPGDLILAIDGKSTYLMSLDEVVQILRGEPGSSVNVTIRRLSTEDDKRVISIIRDDVHIPSLNLIYEIRPSILYVGMRNTRFSESSASEVRRAILDSKNKAHRGIILDLRGNPGGLLSQATQVADLFLPRGAPIVTIREREGRREETRRSLDAPIVDGVPLVVMIDEGSASASEIVAGAIQDNDRGVVLGSTSFGKGSVQTVYNLEQEEETALKLTTARYYTPSGRSIHRDKPSQRVSGSIAISVGDEIIPFGKLVEVLATGGSLTETKNILQDKFGLTQEEATELLHMELISMVRHVIRTNDVKTKPDTVERPDAIYHTPAGRRVKGGGGIVPDLMVDKKPTSEYIQMLERRGVFFEFAMTLDGHEQVLSALADTVESDYIDDLLIDRFFRYIQGRKDLPCPWKMMKGDYESFLNQLENLGLINGFSPHVAALSSKLDELSFSEFPPSFNRHLLTRIKPQIYLRLYGRSAEIRETLSHDAQVLRAVELLQDPSLYSKLLEYAE